MVTYYQILNISRDATNRDVKEAFINTINYMKDNNAKTSEIIKAKKAYKILSEYHPRRNYDDFLDNKKSKDSVIAPNIDGFFRPMLRNSILDDRMSDKFINAEQEFKKMTKQFMNKKDSNSKSYNYLQSQMSNAKKLPDGRYEINTKKYINNNGKEKRGQQKFYYDGQGKLINNNI